MRVALDISSTESGHLFRGIGFYTRQLHKSLAKLVIKNPDFTLVPFSKVIPQADIYHFPAFSPFFFSFPFKLISKSVITVHDLIPLEYPHQYPAGIKGGVRWYIQKNVLKFAQHIITDSQASKASITRIVGISPQKISSIYLAADEEFKPISDKALLASVSKKYALPDLFVLYVGDMNWNKNVVRLAKVCLKLKLPLVVVGKQAIAKDIDKMNQWNTELVKFQMLASEHKEYIKCLGFIPTHELVALYNLATALVHVSFAEGFGLTVLEAMQSGCPTITSNASSMPEVAHGAAILIDPSSNSELESALIRLTNDKTLVKDLKNRGIAQAKKFSWEKTAEQTLAVYKQVCSHISK